MPATTSHPHFSPAERELGTRRQAQDADAAMPQAPRAARRGHGWQRLVVTGLVVLAGCFWSASGGRPHTARAAAATTAAGMTLNSETLGGYAPTNCYHEDSEDNRIWLGSLDAGQSFTVALPFCTFTQDASGPGGAGFLFTAPSNGNLALVATAPDGTVYAAHALSGKGGSTTLARCIVQPSFNATTQMGTGTIEPGVWTVTFTNTGTRTAKSLTLSVDVDQAVSAWQQASCPSQDWNFK